MDTRVFPFVDHMKLLRSILEQRPFWLWLLAVVLCLQCLGMARPLLSKDGSHVYRYATKQVDLEQSHEADAANALNALISGTADASIMTGFVDKDPSQVDQRRQERFWKIDRGIGIFLCLLACLVIAWPGRSRVTIVGLVFAAVFIVVDACCATLIAGKAFSDLSLPSMATRVAAPLGMALGIGFTRRQSQGSADGQREPRNAWQPWPKGPTRSLDLLLRWSLAITFCAHGCKAVQGHAPFRDLISLSSRRIGLSLDETTISGLLTVIGWQDILLAITIVLLRTRWLLWWLGAWGIITAFSRMTAMGLGVYDLTMLRAANGGLALVLLSFWQWQSLQNPELNKLETKGITQ